VVELAKEIEVAGASIINTGIGWHEARIPTIATVVPRGGFAWVTQKMKGTKQSVAIVFCSVLFFVRCVNRDAPFLLSCLFLILGEVSIPLCTTNRINNPETAEGIIAGGKRTFVSF